MCYNTEIETKQLIYLIESISVTVLFKDPDLSLASQSMEHGLNPKATLPLSCNATGESELYVCIHTCVIYLYILICCFVVRQNLANI